MTEMLSHAVVIIVCCLYMALLFVIALAVERSAAAGKNIGNNPVIYTLSLTVYLTAWTFYGSVGKAASTGALFLTIYGGPTLSLILGCIILRKMIRIKNTYRVTSIADFISLRYGKSPSVAALVTIITLFGIVPYIALQLKAITSTFKLITHFPAIPSFQGVHTHTEANLIIVAALILFTIVLGVRKLVPTERHQGMVVAIVVESIVKLIAFLAAGIFVTYGLFGGFGDIFQRFSESPLSWRIMEMQTSGSFYVTWMTYTVLSMWAFMFLPRQFHMAVVENFEEKHIRTAMWLCPLYMLLINLFVLPIAMGGLLTGNPVEAADNFVLLLPLGSGRVWLPLLVFMGGFSAATGMITISSMTISTMISNHLLLPAVELAGGPFNFLKQHLLQCRWVFVAALILGGFWFERKVGAYFTLVDIGMISFVAAQQFAPAMLGGLYWKKGNKTGALLGMGAGFLIWLYTLILPAFARGGLVPPSLLEKGPWGIEMLRPEHLLGVTGLDYISHAVLWTMFFNVGLYVLGSLIFEQSQEERELAKELVNALKPPAQPVRQFAAAEIDKAAKRQSLEELFQQYFPPDKSGELADQCFAGLNIETKDAICLVELAELHSEAEKLLAGSIGAAAAHKAVRKSAVITPSEEGALKRIYADIIAELKVTPSELKTRIDYYREREHLLTQQAGELEERVKERDREITDRKRAEEALRNSERRLADIINFLPDATFVIDLEGKIIIWNRAAEEFTGVSAKDMLGKGNQEYAIPFYGKRRPLLVDLVFSPSEEIKRLYSRVVVNEGLVIGESATISAKYGEVYTFGTAAPLFDSEGNIIGAIESIRDITERKMVEEELKRHRDHLEDLVKERTAEMVAAKDRAEEANRAKSAFLANMSHELRTPLNAILGYTQILKRHENLTDMQRQQLDILRSSGEHLLSLINDVLDVGKIEAQKMELEEMPFDLPRMLHQIFSITKIQAEEKELNFRYEARTPLPEYVRGDEIKLKQILLNLLSNAVKYTQQGSVTLRASYDRDSGLFSCKVEDTGIGIPPDKLESIFEPFTQLVADGQMREGTGLGLTITKRLVTLMNGKVEVESTPGKGSLFRVGLPLPEVTGGELPVDKESYLITGYKGKRKSILIVDDNVANISVLVSLLEPLGFNIATAERGEEAVQKAMKQQPDLVLLDLIMPGKDGLWVAAELKELPKTKIVGISASVPDSTMKDAFIEACHGFLPKPINFEHLLDTIKVQLAIEWLRSAPVISPAVATSSTEMLEQMTIPPMEKLEELHELAQMGDMRKIQAWADKLEEQDSSCGFFAGRLRELAAGFKAKAIMTLVQRSLERGHRDDS